MSTLQTRSTAGRAEQPPDRYRTVVIHIPHASTVIPPEVRPDFQLTDDELALEILRLTDHFTDELLGVVGPGIEIVQYPVSRLVADPERFRDDAQESLAKIGVGAVYTHRPSSIEQRLRRKDCAFDRNTLLEGYYDPHHRKLCEAVDRGLEHGPVLIVDAHSYPREPVAFEQNPTGPRGKICLGTDAFHTPGGLTDRVRAGFEQCGYDVTIDTPFAGSIVPMDHYGKTGQVHSIMIELRRDIYMDEATGAKAPGFERIQADVAALISKLSDG
jgi:N-formylglutamate amidohydrolase